MNLQDFLSTLVANDLVSAGMVALTCGGLIFAFIELLEGLWHLLGKADFGGTFKNALLIALSIIVPATAFTANSVIAHKPFTADGWFYMGVVVVQLLTGLVAKTIHDTTQKKAETQAVEKEKNGEL